MNNAETIYSFWDRYPEMTLMVILVFMASITVFISISATALLQAFQRAIQESVTLIGNGEDERFGHGDATMLFQSLQQN